MERIENLFGMTFFAGFAIIRLAMKLSDYERKKLQNAFPGAEMKLTQKGLTDIKLVLPSDEYMGFKEAKDDAMDRSKIYFLHKKILDRKFAKATNTVYASEADLPF